MCGHATLATAHVLHTTGAHRGPVRFATRSGVLIATPGEDGSVTLDFPTAPLTAVDVPEGVAEALGARPLTAFDTGRNIGDLLVEVADERTVHALRPELKVLASYSERGIIATARAENPALGYDFVSRCFFPNVGIDEDPVTAARTPLWPYWSERLGRSGLTGLQASPRSGRVRTEVRGERTLLSGRAVTVHRGRLLV
ncbi:hypothetical protein GCM10023238_25060 [Streptomyces heliomycini]